MTECGAGGRKIVTLPSGYGDYEKLVHLTCTEDEHEGSQHYDGTIGHEFSAEHMMADS